MAHPLELAACPPDDIDVDPLESGTQLRLVEMAVVGDPAANARIVHLGQYHQTRRLQLAPKRRANENPPDGWVSSGGLAWSKTRHLVQERRNRTIISDLAPRK